MSYRKYYVHCLARTVASSAPMITPLTPLVRDAFLDPALSLLPDLDNYRDGLEYLIPSSLLWGSAASIPSILPDAPFSSPFVSAI